MAWTKIIPRWEGTTAEPPEQKKTDGYIPGDRPPAFWENWFRKGIQEAVSENRVEIDERVKKVGDTILGSLIFNLGIGVRSYKDVLHYEKTLNTVGTLKITMPKSWSNTMMSGKIKGFDYQTVGEWELDFGGYNNTTSFWLKPTAKVNGSFPYNKVRFAHDGSKCCLLIGDTTSAWDNLGLSIVEFLARYQQQDGWGTGWTADIIASEAGISNIVDVQVQGLTPKETIIPISFNAGWTGQIKHSKTVDGLNVYKLVSLEKTTDIATVGAENITSSPIASEFRPTHALRFTAFGYTSGNVKVNGSMVDIIIPTNGTIFIGNNGSVTANVRKILDCQIIGI